MALTRLPGSKWWVETDDVTSEIIGTYNKAFINADIVACNATLANLPSPTQEASDIEAVIARVNATTWADERKARTVNLINAMYQAYQGEPQAVEVAQLIAKRDALIALRDRLV